MSEAARVRESIDLAEFERRLRGAAVDEPQTAFDAAPMARDEESNPFGTPPMVARPAFPRTADAGDGRAASNPVADLRGVLEEAASRPDPFHAVVDNFPNAAERFGAEPEAEKPHWRPEAFEPLGAKPGVSRKRMLLLGGAAAVLVLGVGATLTMRGGSSGGNAPTIRASGEPFKIQPEAKPAGEKPSETASVLDRNGSERLAASRVVTREEQPVDVREAARQASATGRAGTNAGPNAGAPTSALPTAGPAANGFFPEPRRVRTVSVRPDGTIIESTQPAAQASPPVSPSRAAAPAPAPSRPANVPVSPQTSAPQSSAPPSRPVAATPPKTADRAAPATTASTNVAATSPAPSAAVAATPRSGGGAFAVQLAAPGSESEAKSTIARIQQRYSAALGGLQPTVRKATVGEKDVYRVRLVGLSQADANGVCEKLKAAGGSCFVARE